MMRNGPLISMQMLPDVFQDFILELFKLRGIGGDRFLVLDIMSYTKFRPWESKCGLFDPIEAELLADVSKSYIPQFYSHSRRQC